MSLAPLAVTFAGRAGATLLLVGAVGLAHAQPFAAHLDIDRDGLPDAWEINNGSVVGVDDRLEDVDLDGANTYAEFVAGTDPRDATDAPVDRYALLNFDEAPSRQCVVFEPLAADTTITVDGTREFDPQTTPRICQSRGDLEPGSLVEATAPVSGQSYGFASDMPVPLRFAGTHFAVPNVRIDHRYYLYAPYDDAVVTIDDGVNLTELTVPTGVRISVDLDSTNDQGAIVTSTAPILLAHGGIWQGRVRDDAFALPPASHEVVGLASTFVVVVALQDDTQVKLFDSRGQSQTVVLQRAEQHRADYPLENGSPAAVRVVASRPVNAVQFDFGDSSDGTALHDPVFLGSSVGVPVGAYAVSAVCAAPGTLVSFSAVEARTRFSSPRPRFQYQQRCETPAAGPFPGVVTFRPQTPGHRFHEGRVEASVPLHVTTISWWSEDQNANAASLSSRGSAVAMTPGLAEADATVFVIDRAAADLTVGETTFRIERDAPTSVSAGDLGPGSIVESDVDFALGNAVRGTEAPVPLALAGTDFVVPGLRRTREYYLYNPTKRFKDAVAVVDLAVGEDHVERFELAPGEFVRHVLRTENPSDAALIRSSLPILVAHATLRSYHTYTTVVPPADTHLIGVQSRRIAVAALEDATQVTLSFSDRTEQPLLLDAGETVRLEGELRQGRGRAVRVTASAPVAAFQFDDGDGGEATTFFPPRALAQRYVLPVDTQYVAIACEQADTVISVLPLTGVPKDAEVRCEGSAGAPGKAYLGESGNGPHLSAGTLLESNRPFFAYYEAAETEGQRSLFGARDDNVSPRFVSSPPHAAAPDLPFEYAVVVADPEQAPLTVSVVDAPPGMALGDSAVPTLTWTAPVTGEHDVELRADDPSGGFASQRFTLVVAAEPDNEAPVFVSDLPAAQPLVGVEFAYTAVAQDPDGDAVSYVLEVGPAGATLDPVSGQLVWLPASAGEASFRLRASDGRGGVAVQAFTLVAIDQSDTTPPVLEVLSPADGLLTASATVEFTGRVSEPAVVSALGQETTTRADGTFSLSLLLPEGESIVALEARDAAGLVSQVLWRITVDSIAPIAPNADLVYRAPPVGEQIQVRGRTGSVEGGTQISVRNTRNGDAVATAALGDGRFAVVLAARADDTVTVTSVDAAGNASTTVIEPLTPAALTLAPIGDRSVVLGRTLRFSLVATVDQDVPVQFLALPFPLPDNLSLDSMTGDVTFTPSASQVGGLTVTFEAMAGATMVAETVTIDVQRPADAVTVLRGEVLGEGGSPLPGVRLEVGGVETVSDATGTFVLRDIDSGSVRLLIDGSGVDASLGTFATVPEVIEVIEGADNLLEVPVVLLPLDVASGDMVTPSQTSIVTSSPLMMGGEMFEPVTLTVPPGRAIDDATGEAYAGIVHITPVPDPSLGPRPLPPEFDLGVYIAMQPFGVTYDPPVPISFPNPEGFPAGSVVDMFALNHDTGEMEDIGDGVVSFDGRRIDSVGGVVKSNSWHGVVPQAAVVERYSRPEEQAENDCPVASRCDMRTGALLVDHSTPAYRSLDSSRSVGLVYNSLNASVRPIVDVSSQVGNQSPPPTSMSMRLTVGGVEQGSELHSLAGLVPAAVFGQFKATRPGVQFSGSGLPTGLHPFGLTTNCFFPISRRTEFTRGITVVRNERASAFGAGWSLAGLDRLFPSDDGGVLLALGTGRNRAFHSPFASGDGVAYTPPAGDFSVLTRLTDGTWRRRLKDGMVQVFDSDGRLVTSADRNGNTIIYAYDDAGRLRRMTDPMGLVTTLSYSPATGLLESLTDPANRTTRFEHDAAGDLRRIENPDGTQRRFEYEADSHLLLAQEDERSQRSEYRYDFAGRFSSATRPDGSVVTHAPSATQGLVNPAEHEATRENPAPAPILLEDVAVATADGRGNPALLRTTPGGAVTSRTEADGRTTAFDRDAQFNVERLTRPNGSTRTQTFDAQGNVMTLTESVTGATRENAYDAFSLPLRVTDARGFISEFDRDPAGNVLAYRDALLHETTVDAYDAQGRGLPTLMTSPDGVQTRLDYNDRGLVELLTVTPPPGEGDARQTRYEHDAAGNVSRIEHPDGTTVDFDYDAQNRRTSAEDNLGQRQEWDYDERGNVIAQRIVEPDDTIAQSMTYAYDARDRQSRREAPHLPGAPSVDVTRFDGNGNAVERTNARNFVSGQAFDNLDRLETSTDADGGETNYTWDSNDRLLSVEAPNGALTSYEYDDLGRRTKETSPDRGVQTYSWDASDNLKSVTDARGIVTEFDYDELDRVSATRYEDSALDVSYGYDECAFGTGRLCSVTEQGGRREYAYDAFGNVVTMRYVTADASYTTRYRHDAGNRVIETVMPSGRRVTYGRDALRRLTSVAAMVGGEPVSVLAGSDYRADGLLTGRRFGNGLDEVREYDEQGRLERQALSDALDGSVDRREYTYDANGNMRSRQSAQFLGEYAYDRLDRLSEDRLDDALSELFYDANGNRLERAGERTEQHTYLAGSNRLQTSDVLSLTGAAPVLPASTQFTYDERNRLSAIRSGDELLAEYEYDANGRRTRKRTATEDVVFHYDGRNRLIAETLPDGTPLVDYLHDATGPIAQILGDGVSDELVWLHQDHLGTPRAATDESGAVAWRWDGEAFGATAAQELAGLALRIRFPGQYYDTESGLHYNHFRYYDAQNGRYLRSDPIGLDGGMNGYVYAASNPAGAVDSSGLACVSRHGHTTCAGPGGPAIVFTTPGNWPDYFGPSSLLYHQYDIPVSGPGTLDDVLGELIRDPTPGSDMCASPSPGTKNDASPPNLSLIPSPVTSYLTEDIRTGEPVVVNVTRPGHPLHPGYVARTVAEADGVVTIRNYGEGTGLPQAVPFVSDAINGQWVPQSRSVLKRAAQ